MRHGGTMLGKGLTIRFNKFNIQHTQRGKKGVGTNEQAEDVLDS